MIIRQQIKKHKRIWPLVCLILLGLLLRITYYHYAYLINKDSIGYIDKIERIISEDKYALDGVEYAPFYCILSAFFSKGLGLSGKTGAAYISILAGIGLSVIAMMICRMYLNSWTLSYCTLIIFLVNPSLVEISCSITRDVLYLFLAMGSIFLCSFWKKRNIHLFCSILGGICCGLAIMTRVEGVELFLYAFIWSLISPLTQKENVLKSICLSAYNLLTYSLYSVMTVLLICSFAAHCYSYSFQHAFLSRFSRLAIWF